MSRRPRLALVALTVVAISLAACGRRGPLEPPPGATPPVQKSQAAATDPSAPSGGVKSSLARDTSNDNLPREQLSAPASPSSVPNTPFVLDPLLK